jgi:hypothetical protein
MENQFAETGRYSWVIVVGFALGCSGQATDGGAPTMETLDLEGQSFEDVVPAEHHTSVTLLDNGPGAQAQAAEPGEGASIARLPAAEIDARGTRAFFPMPRAKRSFRSQSELVGFIVDKFGADEIVTDPKTGEMIGARGSYVLRGESAFEDTDLGLRFHVREPILAYVAGVSGIVEVNGKDACIDPDGECDSERASYLDIEGEATKPTHLNKCDGAHCSQFHSFFNTTSFPWPWARHGSNVIITAGSIADDRRLATGAKMFAFGEFWSMPTVVRLGDPSVETARWTFNLPDSPEYNATAVCGTGQDSEIGTFKTGNGPQNALRCGN